MCAPKKQMLQLAVIGATAYATGGSSFFASSAAQIKTAIQASSTLQTLAGIAKYAVPAIGVAGQIYSGHMQSQMLKSKAMFVDYQVTGEKESYALRKVQRRRQLAIALGKQRAMYGMSGVTLEGTPGDILEQTREGFAEDQFIDTFNTSQSILSKKFSSTALRSEAKMAKIGGYTSAAVTLGTRGGLFDYEKPVEYSTTRPAGLE